MHPREKLKVFMINNNLTNSQLADIVGKSRQYVTNIINGTKNFGLEFVIEMGYKFPELDLNWWLKDSDEYKASIEQPIVSEKKISYSKSKLCKECVAKDKLIERYERLSASQDNEIKRLEDKLLSITEQEKKTG